MIILIADSGSTKTEWAYLAGEDNPVISRGGGMNPYFCSDKDLQNEIIQNVKDKEQKPDLIFFYGAGCSSDKQSNIVQSAFKQIFPDAEIHIAHDLLGAARALCGKTAGIACILGTGSNSCHFDGTEIIADRPALGYVLGDDGAGSRLGITLLKAYLYDELSDEISELFRNKYKLSKDEVLESVYKKEFPNRYLASFSVFIGENLNHPEMRALAKSVLAEFADRNLLRYEGVKALPIHFTGSVAAHYAEVLKEVLVERELKMGKILASPLQGLINYHLQQE